MQQLKLRGSRPSLLLTYCCRFVIEFFYGIGWDVDSGVSNITCTSCSSNYSVNGKNMQSEHPAQAKLKHVATTISG